MPAIIPEAGPNGPRSFAMVSPEPQSGRRPGHEEAPPADALARELAVAAVPFVDYAGEHLEGLLERIGDARVVLLGEATHGTAEFYEMRAEITKALVQRKGFSIVSAEADWPDAARVDHYVRDRDVPAAEWKAFSRFPTWMWRNEEFRRFVDWMREWNLERPFDERVRFAGLDLYSLYTSVDVVLEYLERVDPDLARVARERYECLLVWHRDPAAYGRAAVSKQYESCEDDVVAVLKELLAEREQLMRKSDEAWFEAVMNAKLIADAERYYRIMYYGGPDSWNLRDAHMFQTLRSLLSFVGPDAKAVVWAHNSHLGNAAHTQMSARGEFNIGQLCKEEFGDAAYNVGFGTDHGTVAAASQWDGPMELKRVRPSRPDSYEHVCHLAADDRFLLPLRHAPGPLRERLLHPRLERAIGVLYLPETELQSHYFLAQLPAQFDEWCWFEESHAVTPLPTYRVEEELPETYPFGL